MAFELSPSEVISKEIRENPGLISKASVLITNYEKKCHLLQPFCLGKLVFLCEVLNGNINTSFDIEDAGCFIIEDLSILSGDRNPESQIKQQYKSNMDGDEKYISNKRLLQQTMI